MISDDNQKYLFYLRKISEPNWSSTKLASEMSETKNFLEDTKFSFLLRGNPGFLQKRQDNMFLEILFYMCLDLTAKT